MLNEYFEFLGICERLLSCISLRKKEGGELNEEGRKREGDKREKKNRNLKEETNPNENMKSE